MEMTAVESISSKACRDCGDLLPPDVRGCPTCALNLEAESMIERFIWRRFVPALLIIAVLAVAALFYLFR
jgi:hypothetical protein